MPLATSHKTLDNLRELHNAAVYNWYALQKRSDMTDSRSAKKLTEKAWKISNMTWELYRDYMNKTGLKPPKSAK
jgi:hypothetical protein